jgi:hypothetical protein
MAEMTMGCGMDQSMQVGAMINDGAVDEMVDLVTRSVEGRAHVMTGGKASGGPGAFYPPTVLTDIAEGNPILDHEIFGPIAPLVKFETEQQAIALANATPFGLASYVFTADLARAVRVSEALDTGMVGVNRGLISDPGTTETRSGRPVSANHVVQHQHPATTGRQMRRRRGTTPARNHSPGRGNPVAARTQRLGTRPSTALRRGPIQAPSITENPAHLGYRPSSDMPRSMSDTPHHPLTPTPHWSLAVSRRSGIAIALQVPLGQRGEDSAQSEVGRRPVCRLDEGNLFEQIGGAPYAFHRIDQRVFVLDVQRAVITGGPKVVDEVGPKRRATGVPESQRHVVPGARTGFGDGHGVQQTVARRHPVVDANVLGVHVEDHLAQLPDHCRNVRAHPHQVGRVEVCANDVAAPWPQ